MEPSVQLVSHKYQENTNWNWKFWFNRTTLIFYGYIKNYWITENRALLEKASEYFDDADLNQDGELNPAELQAFVRQLAGLSANEVFTPEEQKKMFSDLDKDNDRALSRKGNICYFILHIRAKRRSIPI